jgi:hypothetical protein
MKKIMLSRRNRKRKNKKKGIRRMNSQCGEGGKTGRGREAYRTKGERRVRTEGS